ncbi:hypothetical protein A3SI_12789 [Nitritalea halalkaliphila LW7]|uniref:Uncharacterized protein n=1 Tax=Nitritalea halalkaliphila LW7 TaxID=1189621 RepID=I5C1L5_9BACT|nr:hypothetical protein [Nitritalea halalkaliphila]EIM75717.1 hypothetical protein A3SI_12789 [Nitritalea halalkaliphila LW7]
MKTSSKLLFGFIGSYLLFVVAMLLFGSMRSEIYYQEFNERMFPGKGDGVVSAPVFGNLIGQKVSFRSTYTLEPHSTVCLFGLESVQVLLKSELEASMELSYTIENMKRLEQSKLGEGFIERYYSGDTLYIGGAEGLERLTMELTLPVGAQLVFRQVGKGTLVLPGAGAASVRVEGSRVAMSVKGEPLDYLEVDVLSSSLLLPDVRHLSARLVDATVVERGLVWRRCWPVWI